MAIGDQDHRCIAMAMPIALSSIDQPLDLARGEIAARREELVRASHFSRCRIASSKRGIP
jgi:hypothetical protein